MVPCETDSEITFEYRVKSKQELEKFKQLQSLPFQVQIRYSKLNGMRCLRIISKTQKMTQKKEDAVKDMRVDILASNALNTAFNLAEQGDSVAAMNNQSAWSNFLSSNIS